MAAIPWKRNVESICRIPEKINKNISGRDGCVSETVNGKIEKTHMM